MPTSQGQLSEGLAGHDGDDIGATCLDSLLGLQPVHPLQLHRDSRATLPAIPCQPLDPALGIHAADRREGFAHHHPQGPLAAWCGPGRPWHSQARQCQQVSEGGNTER